MAESQTKIDAAAEKAYAEAAEKKTAEVNTKAVEKAVKADKTAPVKTETVAKAVASKAKKAPAKKKAAPAKAKKVAAKKAPAKKPAAKKAAPKKVVAKKAAPAPKKAAAKTSVTPITKLKDTIMATAKNAKTTDYTAKAKEMAADVQTRAKAAYDKGAEMTQDVVEFQKGNFEALVESGKILASGMQDMGRTYVAEAKSAAETVQADVKKVAAVKSPTELFQLQGEIARRNFDAMVSTTSKNTEAMIKLANEAFAPLSSRMSLAAEKVRKAA
ncbi:phasin family protein [Qipengyuania vesicularis]|uniref:phasin family protein n=1 Tax=Qipengyuania vesicularis TaxID=2867232 RepID=UPI001C8758E0|nr:phasin family protein [Qipengyuania vesicularis]MBX7527761.1 phasin family protein [Qipengyuania vesicularis]